MDSALDGISVEFALPNDSINQAFTPSETLALQNFLGASSSDASKLATIAEFVREGKTEFSDIDLLSAVRSLETRLGLPKLGEKRVDRVYQYVKLQRQIDGLASERDRLLR